MAFMDSVAKPPREVRRQQLRYGTAGVVRSGDAKPGYAGAHKAGYAGAQSLKHKAYIPMKPQGGHRDPPPEELASRRKFSFVSFI